MLKDEIGYWEKDFVYDRSQKWRVFHFYEILILVIKIKSLFY